MGTVLTNFKMSTQYKDVYVLIQDATCGFVDLAHISDPFGPIAYRVSTVSKNAIDRVEFFMARRAQMHEYFAGKLLEQPFPFALEYVIGPMSDEMRANMRKTVTQSMVLRQEIIQRTEYMRNAVLAKYLLDLIDYDIPVGHHLVTRLSELIERAIRRTVDIKHQYFAPTYLAEPEDVIEGLLDKYGDEPALTQFDIPSIVHALYPRLFEKCPIFQTVPLRPMVDDRYRYATQAIIDADGIRDMIARDGWTPKHLEFAKLQLKSCYQYAEFCGLLRSCKCPGY